MTIRFSEEYWLVSTPYHGAMSYKEGRALRLEEREKVKAAGFKTQYRYKLSQHGLALAMAKKIKAKTGIEMQVGKAFDMGF